MEKILDISDSGLRVDPLDLEKYLTWLESKLDPDHLEEVEKLQLDTFDFKRTSRIPVLVSTRNDVAHLSHEKGDWPTYAFHEMWHDPAAMLLNELFPAYESAILRDDKVFSLRPNLSQLFIPGFFGATGTLSGKEMDDMPYLSHIPEWAEMEKILDKRFEIESSFMAEKYISIIEKWKEFLSPYSRLQRYTHFALPDLQGPFNVFFLLRGVNAYIDFFDNPDLIDRLLKEITDVIAKTVQYLAAYLGETEKGYCWNYGYPGLLRNVDDNSTLISREQYLRFVHPWNVQLTERCGGGIHHYCGEGSHIARDIMSIPGINGLNFGNPEMQNRDEVAKIARETRTVLLWDELIPPQDYKKISPEGYILKTIFTDLEEAESYMNEIGASK